MCFLMFCLLIYFSKASIPVGKSDASADKVVSCCSLGTISPPTSRFKTRLVHTTNGVSVNQHLEERSSFLGTDCGSS